MKPDTFLADLTSYVNDKIVPQATRIDSDPKELTSAFDGVNKQFLRKLWFDKDPIHPNRALLSDLALEKLAEVSGALALTAAQYMGACRYIASSPNAELVEAISGSVSQGQMTLGVGTTHMKPGPCVVNATKTASGVTVNGTVPWATGYQIFSHLLVAARVGTNGLVVVFVPFQDDSSSEGGQMKTGGRFNLSVMDSTNTLPISFKNFHVDNRHVLLELPDSPGNQKPVPPPFYVFPVGCARAALRLAKNAARKYGNGNIDKALSRLESELQACAEDSRQVYTLTSVPEIINKSIAARSRIDDIVMRSIHAALPLVGGRSNTAGDTMGRLAREAGVYSTSLLAEAMIERKLTALTDFS